MAEIELQDVELQHKSNPRTFSIPRKDQRQSLKVGHIVKLVFLVDPKQHGGATGERMWVRVKAVTTDGYVGTLENAPRLVHGLSLGDDVNFGPEHVSALERHPEGYEVPYGKRLVVSKLVLDEDVWPTLVIRTHPQEESFSGWWIFSGEESTSQLDDWDNFTPITVDEIIDRFRILDSVLDEPIGSKWQWNAVEAEYERVPD
jgi:hypothetical protein